MASPRRPITGVRLSYEIQMDGKPVKVRMKQSIGEFLSLTPKTTDEPDVNENGVKFLPNPGGFRYQSFMFLVDPGTVIKEYIPGCNTAGTRQREICSFTIGFGRGPKENRINGWKVKQWIRRSRRAPSVWGMITPAGTKHAWRGPQPRESDPLIPGLPNGPDLPEVDPGLIFDVVTGLAGLL